MRYQVTNNSQDPITLLTQPNGTKPVRDNKNKDVRIKPLATVPADSVSGGFAHVYVNGYSGYVATKYVFVTDTGSPVPVPDNPPPSGTDPLGWLIGDYELYGKSRPELNNAKPRFYGLPMTERYYDTRTVDISKGTDTRKLLFEVFSQGVEIDNIESRFNGLYKDGVAFTDFNPNAKQQIITCNNPVYLMGGKVKKAGSFWYPVRMLKVGKYADMKRQLEQYPLLAFNATISTRGNDGKDVIPFWHLNGADVKVLPLYKEEVNYLPAERVRLLDGEMPSSYFPPR